MFPIFMTLIGSLSGFAAFRAIMDQRPVHATIFATLGAICWGAAVYDLVTI